MNPADTENPNLLLKERLEKARLSANLIRFFYALLTFNKPSSFFCFFFHVTAHKSQGGKIRIQIYRGKNKFSNFSCQN